MTTSDLQTITDQTDIRKYFSMIEHLADDELDPYEYRLLGHYKRVCGENGGTCTEGIRTTADKCKMSQGKASEVRQALHNKGWINLDIKKDETPEGKTVYIGANVTLKDRWLENLKAYAKEGSDGCSPHEQGCSSGEQGCSPHEQKKNKNKKPLELPDGNSEKAFGFEKNQTLYRVVENRQNAYSLEVTECTVVRFTPKRVVVRFELDGETVERSLSPKSLHKEKPKLERKTTPLVDVIALRSFGIAKDAPIGRGMAIQLNDIAGQIEVAYSDMTPEKLDRIYDDYAPRRPQKIDTILGMIVQVRKPGGSNHVRKQTHNRPEPGRAPGRARQPNGDGRRGTRPAPFPGGEPPEDEPDFLSQIRAERDAKRQAAGGHPGGAETPAGQ
jgi:hypothetical protein